jgi:hypothetical protein
MVAGDSGSEPETPAVSSGWDEASVVERKVTLTAVDFTSAVAHMPGYKRPWLLPVVGLAAIGAWNLLGKVALTTNLTLSFLFVLFLYFQRLKRKAWANQVSSTLAAGVTIFRFDDYGFTVQSTLREHRLAWASLAGQLETPESFFVYTTPHAFWLIPKRAFEADEIANVRQWLRSRVVPKPAPAAAAGGRRMLLAWVLLIVTFLSIWHFLSIDEQGEHQHRSHDGAQEPRR